MKNFLKILIVLVLVINIFILVPNTKSKYVSDNDKIKFEAVDKSGFVKEFSTTTNALPDGDRSVIIPIDGYYAIIAKGSTGMFTNDKHTTFEPAGLNKGGIIATYISLKKDEKLTIFIPGVIRCDDGNDRFQNDLELGFGGYPGKEYGHFGGGATIVTLGEYKNATDNSVNRKSIIVMAAGSGAGLQKSSGEIFYGGGGGSNIIQKNVISRNGRKDNYNTNTSTDRYAEFNNITVENPTLGSAYIGYSGYGDRAGYAATVTIIEGKQHVKAGRGYKNNRLDYQGEDGGSIDSGTRGGGGWANGGGGYAGGGGGGADLWPSILRAGAGAGGSSYMSFVSNRQKELPQALYERITNQYKIFGAEHIENCNNGCVLILYLGTDEQAIKNFGA